MRDPSADALGTVDGAGVRLRYRSWPAEEPDAVLIVIHGLFEHSRRYEELGRTLSAAGIAVFAVDLRGHGVSGGRRGHVPRFDRFLDDVARFHDHVATRVPGVPRFLLGHSMGGLIVLRYLEGDAPDVAGAVLSAPWLGTAVEVPLWQRAAAAILDRVLPILPFPSDLEPALLSHDPERVRDYAQDPLIHSTVTPRLWRETARAADAAFRDRSALAAPLLFLLPGDDPVVDTARGLDLARSLEDGDVTIRVLDGYYHESLQERGRAAVLAEIRGWIEKRAGDDLPKRQDGPAPALHEKPLDAGRGTRTRRTMDKDRDDTVQNDTTVDSAVSEQPEGDASSQASPAAGPGSGEAVVETGAEPDDAAGAEDSTEVEELREELDSLNDRHLRLAAEFDNYRKRNRRDRETLATRLQADLVGSLLDVLDDLQRVAEGSDDVNAAAVLEGVQLVEKKFMTVLEAAGLTPVEAEGRFDPEVMEALGTVPTDDPDQDGEVADVFQRGYRLQDMLLRPARVRVYQYEDDE
ncbi:MAG: nucleotide exchange factor GrpE [Gemmatimonadota bacterium]